MDYSASTLYEKFRKANTDKHLHGYESTYSKILNSFDVKSIIEVGVLHGWSLAAWRYILGPDAFVGGFDLRQPTVRSDELLDSLNVKYQYGIDSVYKNNHYDPAAIVGQHWFDKNKPGAWTVDVFIDDGSHIASDQFDTFRHFRGHFNHAYVIEDVITPMAAKELQDRIRKMGYLTHCEESVRYTERDSPEVIEEVLTTDVYIITVVNKGTHFGNTYCR